MTDPVLAFDFGGTKVEVALAAPALQVTGRVTLRTEADKGAAQVVERALAAGRELLAAEGLVSPLSVGVATMGHTRSDGVDLAPNVPGWESLELPATFRAAFPGVPLLIDNDVRAAAVAELRSGALQGVRTGIYVNLGTGVAATIIVEGQPVRGRHDAAGEVGYWVVPGGGGASTLEAEVGGAGVRRRAHAIGVDGGLSELISSGQPAAARIVDEVVEQIALSVTNMALFLDPERVVLGGGYIRAGDRLTEPIRAHLSAHRLLKAEPPIEVVVGRFGSQASLCGAIVLAETAAGAAAQPG